MIVVKDGVTAANGFLANGVAAGIKKSGRKDLALLYSEVPAAAAAAFTTNRFQASPIRISKLHLRSKAHQAIIVNSGNANCANGKAGDRNALLMADYVARAMGLNVEEVLVASTGIIGRELPIQKIKHTLPALVGGLSGQGGGEFSESILTTDTKRKEFAVRLKLGDSVVTIGASAKGAGMIYPNMTTEGHATMLCFITTDAAISKKMLENSLAEAVKDSFNMVSVDADMSTNDSCFIIANAIAGNTKIVARGKDYLKFTSALKLLTSQLARMIARDGEGATKFVEITVRGASSLDDARIVARSVSASNLLKCCIYGEDPNWGRAVAACGASGVDFEPGKVDVFLGGVKALSRGAVYKGYDSDRARRLFKQKDIYITVDLHSGRYSAKAWTCDLSKKYVDINSEYST